MANGLFATPEQVAAAQRAATFNTPNIMGLFAGLGQSVGNVARRGLGGDDTRSLQERDAARIQAITQNLDFANPESVGRARGDDVLRFRADDSLRRHAAASLCRPPGQGLPGLVRYLCWQDFV